jgi:DNA-binding CsgD family transcriptional regulator
MGHAILDRLATLVDQSLLQPIEAPATEERTTERRFAMLETIREFGLEHLAASGEEATIRNAHARYYLSLAERAKAVRFLPVETWESRVEVEHSNVLAAVDWLERSGDDETFARLGVAMVVQWHHHGHLSAVRPPLERVLARTVGPPATRAKLLLAMGKIESFAGDRRMAAAHLDEAVALFRAQNDAGSLAMALLMRGNIPCGLDDLDHVEKTLTEALAWYHDHGLPTDVAWCVGRLGIAAGLRGDLDRAVPLLDEAATIFSRAGDQIGAANMLHRLGWVHLERGEPSWAAARLAESLELCWAGGYRVELIWCFSFLARLAARHGRPEAAARLFGAETALRAVLGEPLPDVERPGFEAGVALARAALPVEEFVAAWATGVALPLAEAVTEARALAAELARRAPTRSHPTNTAGSLTQREHEVLRLVADGATDREIAATLFISPSTVGHHVSSILAKLGVETRRGARDYARRHSLA